MSRKRWIWTIVLIVLAGGVAFGAWAARDQVAYAHIATGYAAKQTCSCLHVSGRPLDSCLADFPAEARGNIDVQASGEAVEASVLFGLIKASAAYEEAYGCHIVD